MSAPTLNRALWQDQPHIPGTIRDSKLPSTDELDEHKILIKVHAWAINPCDYMLQDRDIPGFGYPVILGCDVAGTVVAISPTSRFRIGDRVFGVTANNGFQEYVTLDERLMARIPDNSSLEFLDTVGFGLCIVTAAMLLFGKDWLNLDFPSLGAHTPRSRKTILIWGGSSAVGSNAIQLVTAAGYNAIVTCSAANFDYVKRLGAVDAFDYKDPDVAEKVTAALFNSECECAGILMAAGLKAGNDGVCKVAAVLEQKQTQTQKQKQKQINFATSDLLNPLDQVSENLILKKPDLASFKPFPECYFDTTAATFGGFLPEALEKGVYQVAPPPLVVNKKGLEGIQEAIDLQRLIGEKGYEAFKEAAVNVSGAGGGAVLPAKLVVERS